MTGKMCNLVIFLSIYLISCGNAERTKDKMYENFDTNYACFRRMNGTHQTGCTSDRTGSTGIIHYVEHQHDIDFLLKNGNAGKYVPVIPTEYFNRDVALLLRNSKLIAGIVLFRKNSTLRQFTNEEVCPNAQSGLSNTCQIPWNKEGTALMHEDFPFPIFLLKDEDNVIKIKACFEKFNKHEFHMQKKRSLCSLELNAFMYASTDTPTCLRRSNLITNLNPVKFCDPIGDKNVWASFYPIKEPVSKEKKIKYIMLTARLDASSLFNDDYPGAISPVTGLITLLTTASLLKNIVPKDKTYETNVLFVLFNGESYDYIGSQRFLYDMSNNEFPVKPQDHQKEKMPLIHIEDIDLFVELSQLSASGFVYIHRKSDSPEVKSFIEKLQRNARHLTLEHIFKVKETGNDILPPSSLQTFTKEKDDFPGLILADHYAEYVNTFYNSIYDDESNLKYKYYNISEENTVHVIPDDTIQFYVENIAKIVAYSLHEMITGKIYIGRDVNQLQLVDELFHCYLQNANCKIHRAVLKKVAKFDSDTPFSLYVGVTTSPNIITDITGLTLGWLTGDTAEDRNEANCTTPVDDPVYQYFMMSKYRNFTTLNETECVKTTMNFTYAYSPAFIIEDYDWKSGKYSSWSESSWRDMSVRMFLKPSSQHETATMVTGSTVMVLSMIVIYFVKSRAQILFDLPSDRAPTDC